ncbi:hypothetical protein BJI48_01240 [Helicobacter sp. 11S02596-1]|nr:hypothetical protein BJI48_01240 [Helicobacter sp. 11S02596-1]
MPSKTRPLHNKKNKKVEDQKHYFLLNSVLQTESEDRFARQSPQTLLKFRVMTAFTSSSTRFLRYLILSTNKPSQLRTFTLSTKGAGQGERVVEGNLTHPPIWADFVRRGVKVKPTAWLH